MIENWNRLPREVMEAPSLEVLKTQLGTVLSNLLEETLLEQWGWTKWSPGPFQPQQVCELQPSDVRSEHTITNNKLIFLLCYSSEEKFFIGEYTLV